MATRILLAVTASPFRRWSISRFADEGIEVVAVSNGDLANGGLPRSHPTWYWPTSYAGKNGYELCESIKENPQFRNVPVVLLVGAFERRSGGSAPCSSGIAP